MFNNFCLFKGIKFRFLLLTQKPNIYRSIFIKYFSIDIPFSYRGSKVNCVRNHPVKTRHQACLRSSVNAIAVYSNNKIMLSKNILALPTRILQYNHKIMISTFNFTKIKSHPKFLVICNESWYVFFLNK